MSNVSSLFSRLTGQMIALIVLLVTVLAVVLWYLNMYQITLDEQATLRTEITTLDESIVVGNRAKANVPQLCAVVADLKVQRQEFLSALPSKEQYADLMRTFKLQIGNNKGQLNTLSRSVTAPTSTPLPAGVRSVSTALNVTGSFTSMIGILQSLENQQRFLRMEDVNFNLEANNNNNGTTTENTTNPKLTAAISVIAFVYDAARGETDRPPNPYCKTPTAPTTPTTPEVPR